MPEWPFFNPPTCGEKGVGNGSFGFVILSCLTPLLLCSVIEANKIKNVSLVIDDRSTTPQEIQPYEAVNFRHLRNILTGHRDVLRIRVSDAYLSYENRRNSDGAIGRNDHNHSMLGV
jgi:hypothetical protein